MKIGFWNIAGQTNPTVKDLIYEWTTIHDLDIIVLIECKISVFDLLNSLNRGKKSNYFSSPSYRNGSYFQVFTKLESKFSKPIAEERRCEARRIVDPIYGNFSLVMIHFQSKLHWDDNDQNAHSPEIKWFIDDVEKQVGHDRTVVIGDFNMNPFQAGMVQTTGLHATMDRRVAGMGSRIVSGNTYKFFYNPMWSFFGEKGKGDVNGTFFYQSAKPITYFWNIFDQVILRPSLLKAFSDDSLLVLTRIGTRSLLNRQKTVDNQISDHLPVIFDLNLKEVSNATDAKSLAF